MAQAGSEWELTLGRDSVERRWVGGDGNGAEGREKNEVEKVP